LECDIDVDDCDEVDIVRASVCLFAMRESIEYRDDGSVSAFWEVWAVDGLVLMRGVWMGAQVVKRDLDA
jgi:cephalosporin hydroxylase